MNISELGNRFADTVRGKKVEGTVITPLETKREDVFRYAVRTDEGILDVLLPKVESHGVYSQFRTGEPNQKLERGDEVSARTISAIPWIDGQVV